VFVGFDGEGEGSLVETEPQRGGALFLCRLRLQANRNSIELVIFM
jgi:hypothetical protein